MGRARPDFLPSASTFAASPLPLRLLLHLVELLTTCCIFLFALGAIDKFATAWQFLFWKALTSIDPPSAPERRWRRSRWVTPRTPLGCVPPVTVQVPMYNETTTAERVIDAVCALEWPLERLQIMARTRALCSPPRHTLLSDTP